MSVKNETLDIVQEIYLQELGVSWPDDNPGPTHWRSESGAFPNQLAIKCFVPVKHLGKVVLVNEVNLYPSEDMNMFIRRADPPEFYEDDFTKEYFLEPFRDFLENHDHSICMAAHEPQRSEIMQNLVQVFQTNMYDGQPVRIIDNPKRSA